MDRWHVLWLVTALIIIAAAVLFLVPGPAQAPGDGTPAAPPSSTPRASLDDLIVLDSPLPGEVVASPLIVTGKARGTWYFEASFPVTLTDWDGRIIAEVPAQAQGEWMTTEYVPFVATLTFENPS